MVGEDNEAHSNCVIGAVRAIINYYNSDEQAKELCESFEADLRTLCLKTVEEYYEKPSEQPHKCANRLAMSRVIATYMNASELSGSRS